MENYTLAVVIVTCEETRTTFAIERVLIFSLGSHNAPVPRFGLPDS